MTKIKTLKNLDEMAVFAKNGTPAKSREGNYYNVINPERFDLDSWNMSWNSKNLRGVISALQSTGKLEQTIIHWDTTIAFKYDGQWYRSANFYSATTAKRLRKLWSLGFKFLPHDVAMNEFEQIHKGVLRFDGKKYHKAI